MNYFRRQHFLLFIIAFSFIACTNNSTTKTERAGEPDIYTVQDEDSEMNEAIKTANKTLEQFNTAIKSANPRFDYFAIKSKFKTTDGGEHIWIGNITLQGNIYRGIVNNSPKATTEVHLGDTIDIDNNTISDWMYLDNQKLCGGYTIRVIRDRLNETEKKQFDNEIGFIIED